MPSFLSHARTHRNLTRRGARIEDGAYLVDATQIAGNVALLSVDTESFVGRVHIALHDRVTIGRRVCINDGAKILTASHDIMAKNWPTISAPITIEDYVWIATDATILPGVTIGRGAVVGASSVVTRDIPDFGIAVGNPARVLDRRRTADLDYSPVSRLALFCAWVTPNYFEIVDG